MLCRTRRALAPPMTPRRPPLLLQVHSALKEHPERAAEPLVTRSLSLATRSLWQVMELLLLLVVPQLASLVPAAHRDPTTVRRPTIASSIHPGFSGSAEMHRFVSTCMDAETARVEGKLSASKAFCGCAKCARFDFSNCLMHGLGGMDTKLKGVKAPRVGFSGAPSQMVSLEAFAKSLEKGQLRAVRVDSKEKSIEGSFWLARIEGSAKQATERQALASELFEAGWWIVEIQWYKREEGSTRNYKLLPRSKRWLTVQAIIRIDGLRFEGGRDPRSGSQVFSATSRELCEACLS